MTLCSDVFVLCLHAALQLLLARSGLCITGLNFFIPACYLLLLPLHLTTSCCRCLQATLTLAIIILKQNIREQEKSQIHSLRNDLELDWQPTQKQSKAAARHLAQDVYKNFPSYNWKPWNPPWFVFFDKDWWALFVCLVWTPCLHFKSHIKKTEKNNKNIFVGRKC